MSALARVRTGATVAVEFLLDGYPTGAAPTLGLTLPDGTAFSASMAAIAGPVVISSMADDRQTLTLASSISDDRVTRERGQVAIKADGQIIGAVVDSITGTTARLAGRLPSGVTPESMVWLIHRATVGPTYGAGDGPTAEAGRLGGTISYTTIAPGDGATETRTLDVALEVEARDFWTGVTEAGLLRELDAYDDAQGGLRRLMRGAGLQPLIEQTLDELRDHVIEALSSRGYRLDALIGAGDFFQPHVLLCRAELVADEARIEALRARAFASASRKARNLKLDVDEDGIEDAEVNAGVGLPSSLGRGFTTDRTFTRSYIP